MALSVVALVAAILITSALPNYRPRLHAGERYGIDVSHHQGAIDWASVARDDVAFAYIKATESVDFVDDQFGTNWDAARAEGIQTGAYHVFSLCAAGADQAAAFLDATPGDSDLPPAVDLEFSSECTARPPLAAFDAELAAFVSAVQDTTGQSVTLYVGQASARRTPSARSTDSHGGCCRICDARTNPGPSGRWAATRTSRASRGRWTST